MYTESDQTGRPYRERYLAQLMEFLQAEETQSAANNQETGFLDEKEPARLRYRRMLGYPLTLPRPTAPPPLRMAFAAEDELGKIYRVWIETLPKLETYGLYFLPHGSGPFPLVLSQHGGLGTPELCSGLHDSANYNNMSRRVHARGIAVLAPQLLIWGEQYGPAFDRGAVNYRLRQLGGTITSLELWQLQRSLDAFLQLPEIDPQRVGMVGLSYGGYYTQFMAALDPRIRVALNSCYLTTPRAVVDRVTSWIKPDPSFGFAQWVELIAPRAYYMETGETDDIIPPRDAPPLVMAAYQVYQRLGIPERFAYKNHPGWHEFDPADDGIEFLVKYLMNND